MEITEDEEDLTVKSHGDRRRSRSSTILPKITEFEIEITKDAEDDDFEDLNVNSQGKISCKGCANLEKEKRKPSTTKYQSAVKLCQPLRFDSIA